MDIEVYGVVLVPTILGLVEVSKRVGLPDKWSPILSVILGLFAGILLLFPEDIRQGIVVGLALGLSATGLYSGAKNINEEVRK